MGQQIQGYSYNTEVDAKSAIQDLNQYFQLPQSASCVTKSYAEYFVSEIVSGNPDFYYIEYNSNMVPVLGNPKIITVNKP